MDYYIFNKRRYPSPPRKGGIGVLLYCPIHGQGLALRNTDINTSDLRLSHHHCVKDGVCIWENHGDFMFIDGKMHMMISQSFREIEEMDNWKPKMFKNEIFPNPYVVYRDRVIRSTIIIQRAYREYMERKRIKATLIIQKAFRKARYNPEYKMCNIIQIKNAEEDGYTFSN
jgi:hypothetical protein